MPQDWQHVFDGKEAVKQMLSLYLDGWSFKSLHQAFGYHAEAMRDKCMEYGVLDSPFRKEEYVWVDVESARWVAKNGGKGKYDDVFDELQRPGKTYKQYLKEQAERDEARKDEREAYMERLRAEKRERDEQIRTGKLVVFEEKYEFNTAI